MYLIKQSLPLCSCTKPENNSMRYLQKNMRLYLTTASRGVLKEAIHLFELFSQIKRHSRHKLQQFCITRRANTPLHRHVIIAMHFVGVVFVLA